MSKDSQKGQSLMEILVGLGIISIMVGASTYALVSVMRSSSMTEQNQSAGLIANSLLESVSTLAEANWNSIYNIQKTLSNHYYLVRSSTTTPTPVYGDEGVLEQDIINGLVGHWKMDEHSGTTAYDSSGNGNYGTLTNIPDINSGLVGYWKFDEESGTTATDFSGYNNTGTLVNSPIWNNSLNCKIGGCLSFNGMNQRINLGSVETGNLVTVSAWIKTLATGLVPVFSNRGVGLYFGVNTNKFFIYDNSATPSPSMLSNISVNDNNWHNVVWVSDGVTSSMYVDGVLDKTQSQARSSDTGTAYIGYDATNNQYFPGNIDDVRIYNRALSASEVSRLYSLNNCKVGSCLVFNGTNNYIEIDQGNNLLSENMTAAMWIYPTSWTHQTQTALLTSRASVYDGLLFFIYNQGNLHFDWGNGSDQFRWNTGYQPPLNTWTHIAIKRDSNGRYLYVNGTLRSSTSIAGGPTTANTIFRLGADTTANQYYYQGSMDDVRIYNRALSASEISQLYNSPVYSRYFYVDNVKRTVCGTGDITSDAESTCIGTSGVAEDPATQKITVGTSWNFRGIKDILENYIYVTRWVNSAGYQSDWSGNAGITSAVTEFASNYFSADGIEVTASGTIKATLPSSSAKVITGFSFASPSATGTINETNHTIEVIVPAGTNVASLTPTISISADASVNPASGVAQDFTNPVTYTVTAEDETTQDYVVTVSIFSAYCGAVGEDTEGMISYWKFDGDATDYFGSNNGTNNGAVSTVGKVGNALSFDGVNDYVLVPNSASLNPQQISISAWLYIKDTTWSYPGIIDKDGYYAGWKGYSIAQYFSTPSLIFEPWSPNDALISTNPLSTYQWNHVVITLGGGTFKMYINGVLDKNVATSGGISPLSTGVLLIGSRATATGPQSNSYFNGFIDEVAIFNRVLSDDEILALYNTSNAGSPYCQKPATFTCGSSIITDVDGFSYPTVQIGTQCWTAKNMNTGMMSAIASGQGTTCTVGSVKKYCYSDTITNCNIYGGLYTWTQAMCGSTAAGAQGICPTGWHIPTDPEYVALTNYLGSASCATGRTGNSNYCGAPAGDRMKAAGLCQGRTPCGDSGFNELLGGNSYATTFQLMGTETLYWTSTMYGSGTEAWRSGVRLDQGGVDATYFYSDFPRGRSIRCIKD